MIENLPATRSDQALTKGDLLATFADFLRLNVAQGDASPETVRTYQGIVRQYVQWCADAGVHPATADEDDLKRFRAHLVEHGYKRTTVATKLAVVRRFYQMLQARGRRSDNPAEGLRPPKDHTDRSERVKWLPLAGLQQLLNSPDTTTEKGLRDRAVIALMALHGLRTVEVARLNVADVDFEAGDAGQVRVLGKGQRLRTILLVEQSAASVRAWLAVREQVAAPEEGALFVSLHWGGHSGPAGTSGRRVSRRGVRNVVDGYLRTVGLKSEGVSCHSLRHSFATLSKAAGADLLAISKALGHSSVTTTEVYADIVDKVANNPARFLVGSLGALGSE